MKKRISASTRPNDLFGIYLRSKLASFLFLGVFVILPLIVTRGYYNLTETKAVFVWILAGAAMVGVLVLKLIAPIQKESFRLDPWEIALLIFLVIELLSALFSAYPYIVYWGLPGRYDGLVTAFCYAIIAWIIHLYYQYRTADGILVGVCFSVLCGIGIAQLLRYNPFSLYPTDYNLYISGFLTLLGNFNIVSSACICAGLFLLGLFLKDQTVRHWFYLLGYCTCVCLLLIANSSSGWVALFGGFAVLLPLCLCKRDETRKYSVSILITGLMGGIWGIIQQPLHVPDQNQISTPLWFLFWGITGLGLLLFLFERMIPQQQTWHSKIGFRSGIIICLCVLLVALFFIFTSKATSGILFEIREILYGNLGDSFMSNRGFIWRYGVPLFLQNPFLGSGPDTFGVIFETTYPQLALSTIGTYVDKAHNEYLQILITSGSFGLLSYIAILFFSLKNWWRNLHTNIEPFLFAAGISCIGYLVQAFFNISVPITAPLFWCMLGICSQSTVESGTNHIAAKKRQ